jgi:hypothetical protein
VALSGIIADIDAEILKLQQARAVLSGITKTSPAGRGRPKGSKNAKVATAAKTAAKAVVPAKSVAGKRKLSPEGRKRIADAMKKRWADRRKQTTKADKAAAKA